MSNFSLPVPADRVLPAWSPLPQHMVPYPDPTQWQAYIPMITQQCATIITHNQTRNPVRCFAFNLFSSNGWQNEAFNALVIWAIDYLNYLADTNQTQPDVQSTITQACDFAAQGISVANLQVPEYAALQQMLSPAELQQSQGALNEFNQIRNLVAQNRQRRQMQQQPQMMPQMGMPGVVQPMGMTPQPMGYGYPQSQPMMMQPPMMGGDPRFSGGGMQQRQPMMQVGAGSGGVYNMPGMPGMFGAQASPADQREVMKATITRQREMLGGGGRWNKATDATVDKMYSTQTGAVGMTQTGGNMDSRFKAAAATTPSPTAAPIAAEAKAQQSNQPTPQSTDATIMSDTTFQYPEGYFRDPEKDSHEDRAMRMMVYRRMIQLGQLPPDALTPYDEPPKVELTTQAPAQQVQTTAKTQREPAQPAAEDDPETGTPITEDNSPQAAAGRWWDISEEENGIPTELTARPVVLPVTPAEEATSLQSDANAISSIDHDPLDRDYTLEDEGSLHRWVPHEGQWYRPLYQPTRSERKLKVYLDGRPNEFVILDRKPEDTPNMDYAQHVLNTPSGRRERLEADADRILAAQKIVQNATNAYYHGVEEAKDTTKVVLENPVTSFDVNIITEVEGAEATIWMINNVKRALREKETGETVDVCVSNALLYEAVYCRNDTDVEFLQEIYQLKDFTDLHYHLQENLGHVDKGVWELVNRRATVMLNQTLVLTMSLNDDVIAPDFFADFQAIDVGIKNSPDSVKRAWENVQEDRMQLFFHEGNDEDLKRNTDSVCYFLPDDKDEYLNATQYLASLCTFTQLSIEAADLDLALEPHTAAQITETATPTLYHVTKAIFTAIAELGETKHIHHLLRTQDGVVYQITHGALVEGSLLISRRQHLWVDAR